MSDTDILQLRRNNGSRVPCYISCDLWDKPLKLLCPGDLTMSQLMFTIRARRKMEGDKSAAYMLSCNNTFPCVSHTISRYDTCETRAVQFRLIKENTFG